MTEMLPGCSRSTLEETAPDIAKGRWAPVGTMQAD